MSAADVGTWKIKNELDFPIKAIDVTARKPVPGGGYYDVNPLTFFIPASIPPKSISQFSAPALKDFVDYTVILAREADAFPITVINPEFDFSMINLVDTVISPQMLDSTNMCLALINRSTAAKTSKLATDLNTLITGHFSNAFIKKIYSNIKLILTENYNIDHGHETVPDNLSVTESYLWHFPGYWLQNQSNFHLYTVSCLDVSPTLLRYGKITVIPPKMNSTVDLAKGKNGGYQVKLQTTVIVGGELQYTNGVFTLPEGSGSGLVLRPVLMSRQDIYKGININHPDNDHIVVLVGTYLNLAVIALPDDITPNIRG